MTDVIIAFAREEDGKNIRNILKKHGFSVSMVCTSAAQVLSEANSRNGGLVVTGYRLRDMMFCELYENLPPWYKMLLIASPARMGEEEVKDIEVLPMPLKVCDLIWTVDKMCQEQIRLSRKRRREKPKRTLQEQILINEAKTLLMEQKKMTEEEAHRYLQQRSMENATSLVETAQMVKSLSRNLGQL